MILWPSFLSPRISSYSLFIYSQSSMGSFHLMPVRVADGGVSPSANNMVKVFSLICKNECPSF